MKEYYEEKKYQGQNQLNINLEKCVQICMKFTQELGCRISGKRHNKYRNNYKKSYWKNNRKYCNKFFISLKTIIKRKKVMFSEKRLEKQILRTNVRSRAFI